MKSPAITIISCLSFFFLSCIQPMSGNGSDVGNARIGLVGHLADGRTGDPADCAVVRLYPVYLNKTARALGKAATSVPALDSTVTDMNGYYKFDSLENNIYSITAEKIDGSDTLAMRCPSFIYIDYKDMGWDTLWLPGSIKGKIAVPSGESAKNITCYISGTSYIAITNDTGGFRITGIPAGTYSVSFMSSKFNDTTVYGKQVSSNQETDIGTITLVLDRSKNEHNVWGVFDTTTDYQKVRRIEARLTGDNIQADSPRVYSLDWRPDVAGYSGFIYLPTEGLFWRVAVWTYDSLDHRIGAFEIPINRVTGDIQFPAFDPCNGIPDITLNDTTVSINDAVLLRPVVSGLLEDDSIISIAWDIGNTGTFTTTTTADTAIIAPADSGVISCVFQLSDRFGNSAVKTAVITVVLDPPVVNAGNDTLVYTTDSMFVVRYSGTDLYGRVVKYRLDINSDGVYDDSATDAGSKVYMVPTTAGNYQVILEGEDDDGNRAHDTMLVMVRAVIQGLVAHWSFDSSAGTTYYDVTGHGYDAVGTGSGFGLVPGVRGQALNCFMNSYEITVANSVNDFYLSKFSIECWFYSNVNPSLNSSEGKILNYQYITWGTRSGYSVDMTPSGSIRFVLTNPDGSAWVTASTPSSVIQAATWYHIACTYDSLYLRIYVNGALSASLAYQGTYLVNNANANIGYQERTTGENYYYLNGRIDELKLYNYALPTDTIAAHYTNMSGP